jgi:hypothetical protein
MKLFPYLSSAKSSTIFLLYTFADMPILINNNAVTEEITLKCYIGSPYKIQWLQFSSFISQSQSYVTTDGQSASLSWYKAPMWGLRPDLYFCQTAAGLLIWGTLSNGRMGLAFARSSFIGECFYKYIKIKSVPHREHIMSMLCTSTG